MAMADPEFAMDGYMPDAKCYAIISRGTLAFRFGPYPASDVGVIMTRALDEKLPVYFTFDCGDVPFDFELARNMRGYEFEEDVCPGHLASDEDLKICGLCGAVLVPQGKIEGGDDA
jgi:hypothetical protein